MTIPAQPHESDDVLSRLRDLAIDKSVEPEELRRLLVEEFTTDLLTQVQEYLRISAKLVTEVGLVSPQRGDDLAEAFFGASPALTQLVTYLKHLAAQPKDWPSSQ